MVIKLSLSDKALDYLNGFCSERNQGRSGKLQWDSFLVYAYKGVAAPPAVELHRFLQENLKDHSRLEELTEDYQRVGCLFNAWQETAVPVGSFLPDFMRNQQSDVLDEFGRGAVPDGLPLGVYVEPENSDESTPPRPCSMSPEMRQATPHVLLIGRNGTGKSCLMAKMLTHDIQSGDRPVVAIDTDGSLVDSVDRWLDRHPNGIELRKRVVIVDPDVEARRLSYNPLEMPVDGDAQSVAASIVSALAAMQVEPPGSQTQWNQQTANILRNAVLLLMANDSSLGNLPLLLSDNDFRDALFERVDKKKNTRPEYAMLVECWAQYKRLARTDQWIHWVEPIFNRVQPSLGDARIRSILNGESSEIKFREIIENGRVLLVKIPQHRFGQNAQFLGSILIAGLVQTAGTMIRQHRSRNRNVTLYVDELDNVIDAETIRLLTQKTERLEIGLIGATRSLFRGGANHKGQFANMIGLRVGTVNDHWERTLGSIDCIAAFALEEADAQVLAPRFFRAHADRASYGLMPASERERLNVDMLVCQEARSYTFFRQGAKGLLHLRSAELSNTSGNADSLPASSR